MFEQRPDYLVNGNGIRAQAFVAGAYVPAEWTNATTHGATNNIQTEVAYTDHVTSTVFPAGTVKTPWRSLGGIKIPVGDSKHQRDGKIVYLQKTKLQIQIACTARDTVVQPDDLEDIPFGADLAATTQDLHWSPIIHFRVIVFKPRYNYSQGRLWDPNQELFRRFDGTCLGPMTNSVHTLPQGVLHYVASVPAKSSTTECMREDDYIMLAVNRANFKVHTDFQFTLSPPDFTADRDHPTGQVKSVVGSNSDKYHIQKTFMLNLPHYKRVTYDNSTDLPENYSPHWSILVLGRPHNNIGAAQNWRMSMRGVTNFIDV